VGARGSGIRFSYTETRRQEGQIATHRRAVHREGPWARSSRPTAGPAAPHQQLETNSLFAPSWQSWAWHAHSRNRGWIPPCWPRRWKTFIKHAARPWVRRLSLFFLAGANALLDQAEVSRRSSQNSFLSIEHLPVGALARRWALRAPAALAVRHRCGETKIRERSMRCEAATTVTDQNPEGTYESWEIRP